VFVSLQKNNERFELKEQYNIDVHAKPRSGMPLKDQFKKFLSKTMIIIENCVLISLFSV